MRGKERKILVTIIGITVMVIVSILGYKLYIHQKYFTIEVIEHNYKSRDHYYNSRSYGFTHGGYYELTLNNEVIYYSNENKPYPFSKEGEIVFNQLGQLFVRDMSDVYEVTDNKTDFLFNADSLHFAQRVDNKVYYVTYIYTDSYKESYYELYVYDDETKETNPISKVLINDYRRTFARDIDFIIEDHWLVFAEDKSQYKIGLLNLETGEITGLIEDEEGDIEYIRLVDGCIYYKNVTFSDIPSYGVDDIHVEGGEVDYCYDIDSNKIYKGTLDINRIIKENDDLKALYSIEFESILEDEEIKQLFSYIEAPVLIEPSGDLYEYETLEKGYFSFEHSNEEVDIYYCFNRSNVMKYGVCYTEPFLIQMPEYHYVTNIYYCAYDKTTGSTSRILWQSYNTY